MCACFTKDRQKDIALLGVFGLLSACFPSVYTFYSKLYYANLFGVIVAPAGSGKGALDVARKLGIPLHRKLRRGEITFDDTTGGGGNNCRSLSIPADTTAAAFKKDLADNSGIGFMFETEIDTIATANRREHGAYDDLVRKAAEHESITSSRVGEGLLEIPDPKLSIILSGTPDQFKRLLPSTENGFASRFFFYFFGGKDKWVSQFDKGKKEEKVIQELGEELVDIYKSIKEFKSLEIKFTDDQESTHKDYFSKLQDKINGEILGIESSTLRRMGVVAVRVAMILTILRVYENKPNCLLKSVNCSDQDFATAMAIIKVLMHHQRIAMSIIPKTSLPQQFSTIKSKFYNGLPSEFDKSKSTLVANGLGIPLRTSANYLNDFIKAGVLERVKQGHYKKIC